MVDVEFMIIFAVKQKEMRSEIDNHELNGYQLSLLYNSDSIDNIAVLEKTNLTYSHNYRLTENRHASLYQSKSSQNDSLLSTNG